MSVSSHENRKSRSSSSSMNIHLFHKPGHADSLLTQLNLLRQQNLFTDVVLRAGNQSFPCHRAVLAACSRYFNAMFSGGLKESRDDEVNFHDSLHPEVLELLLDYAYSARVLINEENAESLLEAGDMLQFQDIRDASADFLEKNLYPGNCLNMLLLSDAHCCERLLELSWRMALANFTSLCKTEDFLRLPKDKLLELVESEELEVGDEKLAIVSGGDTEFSASSAYRFHSDTFQWSKFGDVTAKCISCRAVTSGNRLYVVGGYCGAQRCKTLDCYDPSSDTWSSVTTVPYSLIPTAFVSTWKYLSA
ncbi:ectoderm-neural cortex protein 1-like [Geospiza fortis]|uniref:Ectoderm-neural cortex protein 1-like n=1 Tax=Geospiza fortis TaxID=48883 RepID=A0A6I9HTE3_GEOFO|nr:ectoderm-neural cortex protein 1-like [Geospiza fortis]